MYDISNIKKINRVRKINEEYIHHLSVCIKLKKLYNSFHSRMISDPRRNKYLRFFYRTSDK